MRNRIIEIYQNPARLRVSHAQLHITIEDQTHKVPLDDLAVLVVAHPQVTYTQAVLTELISRGGTFVSCDEKRMPAGLLLPLDAHSTQTERFGEQLAAKLPTKKRLWQQIVAHKIRMQAELLKVAIGKDHGLANIAKQVRSGDPSNLEGQAARKYWKLLFGSDFRRDRDAPGHNAMLNYGYAILRAATSRAICAAGLHPSLGLHHHNRYNSFCLADDLMEPYRPVVDQMVWELTRDLEELPEMDSGLRGQILTSLMGHVEMDDHACKLFDSLASTASSLANCLRGEADKLKLPTGLVHAHA
ncbi:CRISPR-associated endonuclease Cas1 [Lacunimicrobium album]